MTAPSDAEAIVRSYFTLADARDPGVLDLFDDDVEFYFPRFGVGRGKAQLAVFVAGFRALVDEIKHRENGFLFTVSGDRVVVEGTTEGRISTARWSGGETPGGRFCSVFDLAGSRIVRMYIYLDPDYVAAHDPGFRWPAGRDTRW
ncbi:nuclear transport factor 2 family protein [Streptomyces sp. URMC 129]|uniref:nuclear transport factor 2 family protein n=1 Tax=Streptomyces sp. URMC 129 TaxID=3423407 RepID=UPI003F1A0846